MQFVVILYLAKTPQIPLIASYQNILNHYAWFQKLETVKLLTWITSEMVQTAIFDGDALD